MQTTKRQEITLTLDVPEYLANTNMVPGTVTVGAHVAGLLAAHRDIGNPEMWQVSHLPTGCRVKGKIRTLRNAKALMSELLTLPIDWNGMGRIPDRDSARLVVDTIRRVGV